MTFRVYRDFGFNEIEVALSLRPEQRVGADSLWDKAESALNLALKNKGLEYKVQPGEGAFYGPKIDFHIRDCMRRTWQCGTIQLDFALPERFDCTYEGGDGQRHRGSDDQNDAARALAGDEGAQALGGSE